MFTITLNENEVKLLKMSINHCLETCKDGGARNGCKDCASIKKVFERLP